MTRKNLLITVFIVTILIEFSSCSKDDSLNQDNALNGLTTAKFNPDINYGTMTDQDGNKYKTVTIGTQTWMAENLRTTKYKDGSAIPNVISSIDWYNLTSGAYCNYNNTISNDTIATYGRLYNWYAVNTGKLAPKGWHIPNESEWKTFIANLGDEKLRESGTTHWVSPDESTNETGFTGLPGGGRSIYGAFSYIGYMGLWWSSTEYNTSRAFFWDLWNIGTVGNLMSDPKGEGFSVRCVKD